MASLPSGLAEVVADDEDLARYLTSRHHFNSTMAKPVAFLPEAEARETSVFRHGAESRETLWAIADQHVAGTRNVHGAAIVKASAVRAVQLEVIAKEPPPRHAAIQGWPWIDADPELQKAKQKEIASVIASEALLLRR